MLDRLHSADQIVGGGEQRAAAVQEQLAGRRQVDGARAPVEKPHP
jgi:hypothetical protein